MKKLMLSALVVFLSVYSVSMGLAYREYKEYIKTQPNNIFEELAYYNVVGGEVKVVQTKVGNLYKYYWNSSVIYKEIEVKPYLHKVKHTMSIFEFIMVGREYNVDTHYKQYLILNKEV